MSFIGCASRQKLIKNTCCLVFLLFRVYTNCIHFTTKTGPTKPQESTPNRLKIVIKIASKFVQQSHIQKCFKMDPKIGPKRTQNRFPKIFSHYNALPTSVPAQNLLGTRFGKHFGPILKRFWTDCGPTFDKFRFQNVSLDDFNPLKCFSCV